MRGWLLAARLAARVVVGGVFVWSAWTKIQDPALFLESVLAYDMLPYLPAAVFALVLPMVELTCGIALVFTKWHREAAVLICAMLAAFMVALAQALVRGLDISCGCFADASSHGRLAIGYALVRDVVLLVPSVWLARPVADGAMPE